MNNGKLFICGTPIGNIKDITLRCLDVLKSVDIIACEDTRQSLKLLNYYGISKRLISYHEHNKKESAKGILKFLLGGENVALVTDAGMPCISDPGCDLVRFIRENEIDIEVLPGPTAFVTAVALSGIDSRRFVFEGFIDNDKASKKEFIERVKFDTRTTIIYEAPHRLIKTLEFLQNELGNRKIFLARELTKIHEQIEFGAISEVLEILNAQQQIRGEYVILIEGMQNDNGKKDFSDLTIDEHLQFYLKSGSDLKSAIKNVAHERHVSRNEIYKIAHRLEN